MATQIATGTTQENTNHTVDILEEEYAGSRLGDWLLSRIIGIMEFCDGWISGPPMSRKDRIKGSLIKKRHLPLNPIGLYVA